MQTAMNPARAQKPQPSWIVMSPARFGAAERKMAEYESRDRDQPMPPPHTPDVAQRNVIDARLIAEDATIFGCHESSVATGAYERSASTWNEPHVQA